MPKGYKGGEFEREICKVLSRWWTGGARDDVFWRSSQSGGRATQRAKSGKTTYGSYGDIAAVDPIGEPLLQLFTIELKRGSSHSCPGDLIDFKTDNGRHPWVLCLKQAIRSHEQAGSYGWMMIARRDYRRAMVYMDSKVYRHLTKGKAGFERTRFILGLEKDTLGVDFVAVPLEGFLEVFTAKEIIAVLDYLKRNYETERK